MKPDKNDFKQWIVNLRNDFHKYPEVSTLEKRTTQQICEVLKTLDVQPRTFDDLTGVTGLLQGEKQSLKKSKTIALRADIDALPMQECLEKPCKSINDGVMHSCGHDANAAIVLGVAKKIKDSGLLNKTDGTIKFIFQPAEENLGGAKAMIERGVLENPRVDQIIAGHMDPNLSVGTVGVFTQIGHAASDPFELVITGKGSHGARPHKGINPITAGGLFVTNLDSIIPRHISPARSAVISVGAFHAGKAGNVIPEQAVIKGSVRTHDDVVRSLIFKAMEKLVRGIENIFGTQCELVFKQGAPLGINDKEVCKSLYTASVDVLGKENVKYLPFIMGGEDFYYFTQKCPGAIMRFGCASQEEGTTYPLHSPYFDIHEDVLEIGVNVLFKAVEIFFLKNDFRSVNAL
jgi:amidohydrolase